MEVLLSAKEPGSARYVLPPRLPYTLALLADVVRDINDLENMVEIRMTENVSSTS